MQLALLQDCTIRAGRTITTYERTNDDGTCFLSWMVLPDLVWFQVPNFLPPARPCPTPVATTSIHISPALASTA